MCGIFGMFVSQDARELGSWDVFFRSVQTLLELSESRGTEASGVALARDTEISVLKRALGGSQLARSSDLLKLLSGVKAERQTVLPFACIGHCRLMTDGSADIHENNQPVVIPSGVTVHNGIIINGSELNREFDLEKQFDIDTEVIPRLVEHHRTAKMELSTAFQCAMNAIEGTASVAMLFANRREMLLGTNCGSLYYAVHEGTLVFASEKFILSSFFSKARPFQITPMIKKLQPGHGVMVGVKDHSIHIRTFALNVSVPREDGEVMSRQISDIGAPFPGTLKSAPKRVHRSESQVLRFDEGKLRRLRRCKKCILPETFPDIRFNSEGICNRCESHLPYRLSAQSLQERFRTLGGDRPRVLVPVSGGRDSSFILHYLVKEMGMDVVAFTYDWGMITDLARRNTSRMCQKLQVEHVVISADINAKRKNIRRNVLAWLKRPHPGTVSLFMAGDKQFFYHAEEVRKRMECQVLVFGMNPLERTDFKTSYCGVTYDESSKFYRLNPWNQMRLVAFFLKEFSLNPTYINPSLMDSALAFISYYVYKHDFLLFFDHFKWHVNVIVPPLLKEYGWETAPDTKTTWRIGDGTACFYNYIFMTLCGFSESDTFRSNQIREGQFTREEALELTIDDHRPRVESIQWYCDTLGIDFKTTIQRINEFEGKWMSTSDRP